MTDERTRWTDERIDDFSGRLGRFEGRVDSRFDRFESRVDERFERLEGHVDAGFDRVDARFDALNRTMIASMATIVAALIAQILFG
jgi:hypothetical protein